MFNFKTDIKYSLYLIILFFWSFFTIAGSYTQFTDYILVRMIRYSIQVYGVRIICLFLCAYQYNNIKNLAKSFIIIGLAEIIYFFSKGDFLLCTMYFLAASKDLDSKDIVKTLLISNISIGVITVLSNIVGILPNVVMYVDNQARYTLGFTHPNILGIILVQILLMLIHLKKNDFLIFALSISFFIFSYFIAYSRTASLIIIIIFVVQLFKLIISHLNFNIYKCRKLFYTTSVFIILFILIITFGIATNKLNFISLNDLLSGRIYLYQGFFNNFDITLFGQPIEVNSQELADLGLSTLDNSYLFLLLCYGLIIFLCYLVLMFSLICVYIKKKNTSNVFILVLYFIYGFAETVAIRFQFNFSIIFLKDVIWRKNNYEEHINILP